MAFPAKLPGKQPFEGESIVCRTIVEDVKTRKDGGSKVVLGLGDDDCKAALKLFESANKIVFYTVFQASKE